MKKQTKLLITVITCIIVVLSLVQVILSNSLSTTGIALARLERDVQNYQRQNVLLREKILTESSLTKIVSKAAVLGFSKGKSQIVINGSVPIAAKP